MTAKDGTPDRRTKEFKALTSLAPEFFDEIEGVKYEIRHESQCMVCTAPKIYKDCIESNLAAHRTLSDTTRRVMALSQELQDGYDPPSYHSIRNHLNKHYPVDKLQARELVERKAEERGLKIASGSGSLLTAEAALHAMMEIGFHDLVGGKMNVSAKDLIAAATNLRKMEQDQEDTEELDALRAQYVAAWEIVASVMSKEQQVEVAKKLKELQEKN